MKSDFCTKAFLEYWLSLDSSARSFNKVKGFYDCSSSDFIDFVSSNLSRVSSSKAQNLSAFKS